MNVFKKKKTEQNYPNLMKLLFLPLDSTHLAFNEKEWEAIRNIEIKVLDSKSAISTRDLRVACRQRYLPNGGSRADLVLRLVNSINDQWEEEERIRAEALEKLRYRLRKMGGCFVWGYGKSGQLGFGKRMTTSKPTHVESLAEDRVLKVFAGFDGDTVYAVTANDNVYVWGSEVGATGLPSWSANAPHDDPHNIENDEMKLNYEPTTYRDNTRDEIPLHDKDILLPTKIPRLCGERIVEISPGKRNCISRTKDGDIYSWGHNHHGQLGPLMVHHDAIEEDKLVVKPSFEYADTAIPMLALTDINSPARSCSSTSDGSLVCLMDGTLCVWGDPKGHATQELIRHNLGSIKVKQVACGALHSCIIDTNAQVYSWGNGDGGRLGHGDFVSKNIPTLIKGFRDKFVLEVRCAVWHSAAIVMVPPMRQGGWVYTWGAGFHGQLGQDAQKFIKVPTAIAIFTEDGVYSRHISCGRYHTAVVATDGKCYTWGSNRYGCLGRKEELMDLESSFTPVPGSVEYFEQPFLGKVVSVACGRHFTACVLAPYDGPDEQELAEMLAMKRRRKQGIRRVQEYLRKLQMEDEYRMAMKQRREIIEFLNMGSHSGCTFCDGPYDCPGFQPDYLVPTVCRHCEHERDFHTLLRYVEDTDLTNKMLVTFQSIISGRS